MDWTTIRRSIAAGATVAVLFACAAVPASAAVSTQDSIALATNAYRVDNGKAALARNAGVDAVAQGWATHLRDSNKGRSWQSIVLAHNPDFSSQMPRTGLLGSAENVAFACGRGGAAANASVVMRGWKESAGHRANMLSSTSTDLGVGTAYDSSNDCLYAVQNFGAYRVSSPTTVFWDVPRTHFFFEEIDWVADSGISTGYQDGSYRPRSTVTRDAFAAFIYRLAGKPAFTPPASSPFTDVSTRSPFYKEIAWLASTGITTGWEDGTFRPSDDISREAMAAFLYRYHNEPSAPIDADRRFADLNSGDGFLREISWLADSGITTGYEDGTFRPHAPVTREATAAFLERAADL